MRGFFLAVIVIDHMGFFPSVFEVFTGRGEQWASAAEGFIMISGLLVGYVYGPRMARNALQATAKIWKRAFLLYALTVLLTTIFVFWGNVSDIAHVKEGLWQQPALGEFLYKTLTMQYYYGWADFLPYYAIFMAWAPLALYACVRGYGFVVLLVSAACYVARGSSFEMAWQLLFIGAMVAGWYLPTIESKIRALPSQTKKWLRGGLYGSALALVLGSVMTIRVGEFVAHSYSGFATLPHVWQSVFLWLDHARDVMTPLIIKWTLEPVRLLTASVWFAALYVFVRQHEARINRVTRGFLKSLGERSLVVYVTHALVIFALLLLTDGERGFIWNTLMNVVILALVYFVSTRWALLAKHARVKVSRGLQRLQLTNEEAR
jgi:hypothetical protein